MRLCSAAGGSDDQLSMKGGSEGLSWFLSEVHDRISLHLFNLHKIQKDTSGYSMFRTTLDY